MTLTLRRRDPFRTLWTMPTVWDENWVDMATEGGLSMYETEDHVVIEANVAGVPEDHIEISVEGGTVSIKAHLEEKEDSKVDKKVVYRQAREASYAYSVSVPIPVQQDKAEAVVEHGILKLRLPKKDEVKPQRIQIKAKSG